jgi:serine/threonine protein kinase
VRAIVRPDRFAMLEPTRLQDYKLFGALGAGATSRVVEAVHVSSGRRVAIKVLAPPEEDIADELRERFAREALVLSGLNSRHVGKILGFGFEKGVPFLVLEHMVGEAIDARLKREGPLPLAELMPFVAHILMGIRDCHAINVVHRDIKPANVFLHQGAAETVAKIIDFGLARAQFGNGSITSTSHVLGSVGYMAPEQFYNPKSVGPQADLYAAGCLLFRCLSGRLPFMSKSLDAVVQQKCELDPPLLSTMDGCPSSDALDAFLNQAMDRDLKRRFRSAKEMLEQWWQIVPTLEQRSPSTRPRHDSIPVLVEDLALVDDLDVDSGWSDLDETTGINSPRFETLHGTPLRNAIGRTTNPPKVDATSPHSATSIDAWQETPTVQLDGRRLRELIDRERDLAKKK